ncbi:MAG: cbb3-type cytochrome c oxidase subunit I [Actinomycetota bacterium]
MTALDASSNLSSTSTSTHTKDSGNIVGLLALWITTTDHKRIGRLFLRGGFVWLISVIGIGVVLGVERINPTSNIFPANSVVQLFSFFRTGLSLGVLAPLFVGLSIALVPLQIGAQAISYARLSLFGFYAWLIGSAIVVISIIGNGGPSGGNAKMVDAYLFGVGLAIVGMIAAAISVITTIIGARSSGLAMSEIPVFTWSALVGAAGIILTLPLHLGSVVYVAVDHHYGRLAFGGNYRIDKWIGDIFGQPQTFIYVIPALGVLAEIISVSGPKRQVIQTGGFVGIGIMSTTLIGAVTRTQHLFESTGSLSDKLTSAISYALFDVLPVFGVLIALFVSLLALKTNSLRLNPALVPSLLGVGLVFTGMLGYAVQMISSAELAGTVFEEGVFVYIGYGAVLVAIGAISHWCRELRGTSLPAGVIKGLGVAGFIAAVFASLPYYMAGFTNQAAKSVTDFENGGPHALWNSLVGAGHVLMAVVVVYFVVVVLRPARSVAATPS